MLRFGMGSALAVAVGLFGLVGLGVLGASAGCGGHAAAGGAGGDGGEAGVAADGATADAQDGTAPGKDGGADGLPPESGSGDGSAASDGGDEDSGVPPGWRAFTFVNDCPETVWVGVLGNIVTPITTCQTDADCGPQQACNPGPHQCAWAAPGGGGWMLDATMSMTVPVPPSWGGRFWPRTGCAGFNSKGMPACATGDCGGTLQCGVGVGGTPPATLAEFTVTPAPANDFYDVSNVDGSNVPISIVPTAGTFDPNGSGNVGAYYCGIPGCSAGCNGLPACPWNLVTACPPELQLLVKGAYVGCRSANQECAVNPTVPSLACATERDLYGCTPGGPNDVSGSCYSTSATSTCCGCPPWSPLGACQAHNPKWETPSLPGKYAAIFKNACPTAYSFPYDDPTSTFQCHGAAGTDGVGYTITFCD